MNDTPRISTSHTLGENPELWTITLNGETITANAEQLKTLGRIIRATIGGK